VEENFYDYFCQNILFYIPFLLYLRSETNGTSLPAGASFPPFGFVWQGAPSKFHYESVRPSLLGTAFYPVLLLPERSPFLHSENLSLLTYKDLVVLFRQIFPFFPGGGLTPAVSPPSLHFFDGYGSPLNNTDTLVLHPRFFPCPPFYPIPTDQAARFLKTADWPSTPPLNILGFLSTLRI